VETLLVCRVNLPPLEAKFKNQSFYIVQRICRMSIVGADDGISSVLAYSWEVAMVDPKEAKSAPNGAKATVENAIGVEMEDLSDKDRD
jgi:hypothetical protein